MRLMLLCLLCGLLALATRIDAASIALVGDSTVTDDAEEWADRRLQDYPDLTITPEHIFSADDMVAAYVRFAGTHSGDVEDARGVPATGQMIDWVVMVHFRVACGKFVEVWSVGDDLGRLQRLGVITADELQSVSPVATPMP